MDVATLASLLKETAEHHDHYEKTHAPHHWWDWYAAYLDARQQGRTPTATGDGPHPRSHVALRPSSEAGPRPTAGCYTFL